MNKKDLNLLIEAYAKVQEAASIEDLAKQDPREMEGTSASEETFSVSDNINDQDEIPSDQEIQAFLDKYTKGLSREADPEYLKLFTLKSFKSFFQALKAQADEYNKYVEENPTQWNKDEPKMTIGGVLNGSYSDLSKEINGFRDRNISNDLLEMAARYMDLYSQKNQNL